MYDITVLGELLIDFTYYGLSESGGALFEQNAGGAVANVAALCAGFGARTAFLGKVGADMHGAFLRDTLRAKGVDIFGLIEDPAVFTTLAFVKLAGPERSFSFARKPGADTCLNVAELNLDIIRNTRVFHFGSLSLTDEPARSATFEAVKEAKGTGALCSYDPNYRASLWSCEKEAVERMRSAVGLADVMKLSDEETRLLTGENDPEKAARALIAQGVKYAVVTLGEHGALAVTRDGCVKKPAFPCKPIDTTGAGDAFWGAFLYRLVKSGKSVPHHNLDEISGFISFANAAASLCVEGRGGIPSMPGLEDVYLRMR
ncbi:MAG: carbohydrate kinase [Defluviitaleaceae bacterium]|nr:carbohydrate kinase [Defluviitaleaceae bacterium]MCL2836789.1 carbohydrate kinase [Defluviitaleaceae bacterium]